MSQQIIEVLDYLFEKFDIAVDWTSENVWPYVQELAGKIVTYNIVTNAIVVVFGLIASIIACIFLSKLYNDYLLCTKEREDTHYFDWMPISKYAVIGDGGWLPLIVGMSFMGTAIITLLFNGSELIKWIILPEFQLIEYISNLVNTVQM